MFGKRYTRKWVKFYLRVEIQLGKWSYSMMIMCSESHLFYTFSPSLTITMVRRIIWVSPHPEKQKDANTWCSYPSLTRKFNKRCREWVLLNVIKTEVSVAWILGCFLMSSSHPTARVEGILTQMMMLLILWTKWFTFYKMCSIYNIRKYIEKHHSLNSCLSHWNLITQYRLNK